MMYDCEVDAGVPVSAVYVEAAAGGKPVPPHDYHDYEFTKAPRSIQQYRSHGTFRQSKDGFANEVGRGSRVQWKCRGH